MKKALGASVFIFISQERSLFLFYKKVLTEHQIFAVVYEL